MRANVSAFLLWLALLFRRMWIESRPNERTTTPTPEPSSAESAAREDRLTQLEDEDARQMRDRIFWLKPPEIYAIHLDGPEPYMDFDWWMVNASILPVEAIAVHGRVEHLGHQGHQGQGRMELRSTGLPKSRQAYRLEVRQWLSGQLAQQLWTVNSERPWTFEIQNIAIEFRFIHRDKEHRLQRQWAEPGAVIVWNGERR